ncbi:MAG: hypothetical protein [Sclerotinia sclerotiorum narnavirus 2]|nr:MAG: hypothetical protein [Sclerotinia sclerotiorum narnavirus 2]
MEWVIHSVCRLYLPKLGSTDGTSYLIQNQKRRCYPREMPLGGGVPLGTRGRRLGGVIGPAMPTSPGGVVGLTGSHSVTTPRARLRTLSLADEKLASPR